VSSGGVVEGLARMLAAHSPTFRKSEWEWQVVLSHTEEGVKARDRNLADLVQVIAMQSDPSRMRCLIPDLVYMTMNESVYQHLVLYSTTAGAVRGEGRLDPFVKTPCIAEPEAV